MDNNINKDVAVIGLGPSGVTASIYLKRYGMNPVAFEREAVGGQVNKTEEIENYPGCPRIEGAKLGESFERQLEDLQIEVLYQEVTKVSRNPDGTFLVEYGRNKSRVFPFVLLATGQQGADFHVPGEENYHGRGISRCAICDGAFYRNKPVAVIGAGNSAFAEASYLASICSQVTLIARRTTFRADEASVKRFASFSNGRILAPYVVTETMGDSKIRTVVATNRDNGTTETIPCEALFLYVGEKADTSAVSIEGILDEKGYVRTDAFMETPVKGLFAVGDVREKDLRQIATATSDGAIAATRIHDEFLAR
jgi:thioredoxin reductase (NADPH)